MPLTFEVTLSDVDVLALKNDVLSPEQWVRDAITGKANACRKRMVGAGVAKLLANPAVTEIPSTDDGIIQAITSEAGYMDRQARDDDDAAKEVARAAALAELKAAELELEGE
jgi:hypothetical protein